MEHTSRTRFYEFQGQSMKIEDWSARLGISEKTLYARLNTLGWSVELSFLTPVQAQSNFSDEEVRQIRSSKMGTMALSRMLSVSRNVITRIKVGESYRSVT